MQQAPVPLVQQAPQGRLALASQALRVYRAPQAHKAPLELQAHKAPLAPVLQEPQAFKDHPALLALARRATMM